MKETETKRADRVEAEDRMRNTVTARDAITAFLGKWKKRVSVSASGRINCPICGGENTLHFRRASCNGHISAQCTTKGCVSWME